MTPRSAHPEQAEQKTVIILFPEIWRPLKQNHTRMFEALSPSLRGYIVTMSGSRHAGDRIGDFEVFAGKMGGKLPFRQMTRLWLFLGLPLFTFRRRGKIDAVITYDPYATGLPGLILRVLLRTKLIVQIMGDYHRLDPNDELIGEYGGLRKTGGVAKKAIMRMVFNACLAGADAIKVLNRDQEEFVRKGWPKTPVFRFCDFAATTFFNSLPTYVGNYLLAIGYPFHRKGVDVLIRAFTKIADRHPSVTLRILGYATASELESYRRLGGNHDRIEFIRPGWIEDVGEQMRGCYAFVHAARSEAMGRVLLEAMACAKPIICTRTNGGLDYLVDGETALLSEIDDVDGLASAMDALLSDPERAARMGQAGSEHVNREYSEERFAERFTAMVREVTR